MSLYIFFRLISRLQYFKIACDTIEAILNSRFVNFWGKGSIQLEKLFGGPW